MEVIFGSDLRKFRLVKVYKNFAMYECYTKDENNKKIHLFYECFKFSYLYGKEYEMD